MWPRPSDLPQRAHVVRDSRTWTTPPGAELIGTRFWPAACGAAGERRHYGARLLRACGRTSLSSSCPPRGWRQWRLARAPPCPCLDEHGAAPSCKLSQTRRRTSQLAKSQVGGHLCASHLCPEPSHTSLAPAVRPRPRLSFLRRERGGLLLADY